LAPSNLLVFDTGVDVFRVFTEDDHIGLLWLFHWRRHAGEVTHWAQADVQVQLLTQGHVERTDTAANWRGQRAFDGNHVVFQYRQEFLLAAIRPDRTLGRFFASVDFHPADLALASVGFGNSIDHFDHDRADVDASTITFDVRNDRVIWYIQGKIGVDGDF
jgi:hypothetical protein